MADSYRPRLMRPRLGYVGDVPHGAVECTLAEIAEAGIDTLKRRLGAGRSDLRIAFDYSWWRPWGVLGRINVLPQPRPRTSSFCKDLYSLGSVSVRYRERGCVFILNGLEGETAHIYTGWLWTLDTERAEDLYLTRRRPRAAA